MTQPMLFPQGRAVPAYSLRQSISQAKEEQNNLRDKLIEMLKTMEYKELAKADKERIDASVDVLAKIPNPIFVG